MRMSMSTTSGRWPDDGDRLVAVGRLAHDLDVVLGVEQDPEPGADQGLVVGEDDADHARPRAAARIDGTGATGSQARTRKPPPGRGPASSVARRRQRARSRMPAMPWPGVPGVDRRRRRPRPSSTTSTSTAVAGAVDQHAGAWPAPAWRITLVSDSCTIR